LQASAAPKRNSCIALHCHLESLRPEFDWNVSEQPKKRARITYEDHKTECLKFEALKQQRLNGLAHSCSLYQLIAKIARNSQDGVFLKKDLLRMSSRYALVQTHPFDLFSQMLLSPVKRDFVALRFPEIVKIVMEDQNLHQKMYFDEQK
jgi:hypothetical protein